MTTKTAPDNRFAAIHFSDGRTGHIFRKEGMSFAFFKAFYCVGTVRHHAGDTAFDCLYGGSFRQRDSYI